MRRSFAVIVLIFAFALTQASFAGRRSSSSSSSRKSVHVKSYTRKNGTVVRAYNRKPSTRNSSHGGSRSTSHVPRSSHVSSSANSSSHNGTVQRNASGHIVRSESVRNSFMRSHPCPSTGKPSGACSGYVVDHIKPLAKGGQDDPSNMQWQTVQDAKEKDKWERK